jgi:hypothetical protein
MKKIALFLILFSVCSFTFSKNEHAIMYKKDGTSMEVRLKKLPPVNDYEMVYYDSNNKKYKIYSGEIDSMRVWNSEFGKEKSYLMIRTPYYQYANEKGEIKKQSDAWIIKFKATEHITHYMSAFEYEVDKKGILKMKTARNLPPLHMDIMNFFQRPGEEYPTMIAPENKRGAHWTKSILRSYGSFYFNDCPALVELIKSNEFDINNIKSIVDIYPQLCK